MVVLGGGAVSYERGAPVKVQGLLDHNVRFTDPISPKPVLRLHRLLHLRTSSRGILRNQAERGNIDFSSKTTVLLNLRLRTS